MSEAVVHKQGSKNTKRWCLYCSETIRKKQNRVHVVHIGYFHEMCYEIAINPRAITHTPPEGANDV